jgi:hypothetical protein
MKSRKILALILTIAMVFGSFSMVAADTAAPEGGFADMPDNWSTAALNKAVGNGLLMGYTDGDQTLIKPDNPLTRAELAAVVNRAFASTSEADISKVTDVAGTAWYAGDMAKAVKMGTFALDTKMRPDDKITRQEAFAVLARAFKLTGTDADYKALGKFTDKADIAAWALKDLDGLAAAGYVQGSAGKLNPKANITRAEFAVVMDNLVKQYIDEAGTVTEVVAAGNVMVRVAGVTLKDVTVKGDLIIADGVGEGDVTLDSVTVEGRTVVRGGGENSIIIKGNSDLGKIIVAKVDGVVRIVVEGNAGVEIIYVDDGPDDVIVEGTIGTLEVAGDNVTVTAVNAAITNGVVSGDNSKIILSQNSTIQNESVEGNASEIVVVTPPSTGGGGSKKDEEPEVKEAEWKDTGKVGTNTIDGKAYVFQGFELWDAEGKRIDLVANNIESMTVLEPGASEPKTLTVGDDSDPLLWFNVQKATGDYKYTVVTKAGVTYVATLNWTAPAEVNAVKTGDPAYNQERENWYQLYTVEVDVDPEDSKVYQIKPDGEISELTVLADADNHLNIWFRLYGKDGEQQEGEHIFLIKKGDTWSKAVIDYGHTTAEWKDTGKVGTNTIDGKAYVFQGFELLDAEGKRIDLVANNIESMTVLEPGASEPKTLTVGDDSDPLLWFNVQKATGDYKYTVVTKAGVTYVATLNWTAPAEVDAVKTGEPAYNQERENWYQLYTVAVDVDPEDSKVYQIKPDGEISELTVLADADNHLNIWFRLYGKDGEQQEGEHIFLIKKGDTWSKAVIDYGHTTAEWKDTGKVGTNTIDGKAYVFQGFELLDAEGKRIDLVANNIESMTVLEPGASEPKTLTVGDDSDPLLWFNVQKATGDYKYTVVTKAGVTYVATLNWTAPAEVDAVKTGEPAYNQERENWYQLYTVAVDVDPEDSKVYQIKPDGEISELTVLADADNHLNIWFRLYGKDGEQQEGEHIFLIKKGDTWSKAVIDYGHTTAEWKDTGKVGTNTIDGKAYVFQGFELLDAEGKRIDLVANNIESMTVLEPGASEPKTLTVGDDSDPLLWFNVQKATGDYKYTVVTKAGVTYVATLNWTAPAEVNAVKTGKPAYNQERENWYQLYTVAVDVDPEDSKVYQIKPDGEISELTVLADADNHLNIWFRLYGKDGEQQEGEHIFLIKKGDTWSKAVIDYGHTTAEWKDTGKVGTNTIDGKAYVFQGFELLDAEGKRIDLVANNIESMTVLEPGASEPKTLTVGDDSDPLLWFNVQKATGDYKYTVVTKAGVTYVATLNWTAPAEVNAVKTGKPAYNQERENWYQLYTVEVDVDPEDSKVYQIKPDGEISELTVLADADNHLNIWFRLYGKDGEQQEGEHIFLIKKGDTWSKAVIDYGHTTAEWKDTGKVGTNTIDGKAYVFQGFELLDAEGKRIDLVANNIESMTVLEPGASEPKTLTVGDDSDPLLWFNVQKATGDYKYTVVTKAGVTYVATLNWTAPAEVDAVKTGDPAYNQERENWYQLYTVAVDVTPEDSKVYQIKPDGEISELTVLADADNHLNIWFRLYGKDGEQQEGEHIFLIKKGDTWSKAVIDYGHTTAEWKDTGKVGTNTIDGKAYVFQGFELLDAEGKRIDLVASNIESMTVLEPGATEPKTLTVGDDSDPLLWFNVQKATGDYKYTVVTKVGKVYEATIEWTAPASVDAEATGRKVSTTETTTSSTNLARLDPEQLHQDVPDQAEWRSFRTDR